MPLSPGKKFFCLSTEIVANILGVVLILVNLGIISFRIYIISNKQWVVNRAKPLDNVNDKEM